MTVAEKPRQGKKRLMTSELIRVWRDQSQENPASNGGLANYMGDTIYYGDTDPGRGEPVGIRRVREDDSVWFLLNGDDLGSGGWGNGGGSFQNKIRGSLQHVRDREEVWPVSMVREGAPPQPKQEDYGYDVPPSYDYSDKYPTGGTTKDHSEWAERQVTRQDAHREAYTRWTSSEGHDRYYGDNEAWQKEWRYQGYPDTKEEPVYRDYEAVIIPFSALSAANIEPRAVVPVHQQGERTWIERIEKTEYREVENVVYRTVFGHHKRVWGQSVGTGEFMDVERHLMGSTLFKATVPILKEVSVESPGRYGPFTQRIVVGNEIGYFLSGLDESARNPFSSHFIARLPHMCSTVEEAYEILKPLQVQIAEGQGVTVQRQGEWFAFPMADYVQEDLNRLEKRGQKLRREASNRKEIKDYRGNVTGTYMPDNVEFEDQKNGASVRVELFKDKALPDSSPRGSSHRATWMLRIIRLDGRADVFVRGMVKHSLDEHKILRLGKVWHFIHENTALGSWAPAPSRSGGRGRVD